MKNNVRSSKGSNKSELNSSDLKNWLSKSNYVWNKNALLMKKKLKLKCRLEYLLNVLFKNQSWLLSVRERQKIFNVVNESKLNK